MANQEHLIQFGTLFFCLKQKQFFQGNEDVRVEPKVCELLHYLYLHQGRYVSLSELHEELWRGRIVSDTAVRRTVSKLRTLLGEDGSQQGYIRSLSKRGYKLVIPEAADLENQATSANLTAAEPVVAELAETGSMDVISMAPIEPQAVQPHAAPSESEPAVPAVFAAGASAEGQPHTGYAEISATARHVVGAGSSAASSTITQGFTPQKLGGIRRLSLSIWAVVLLVSVMGWFGAKQILHWFGHVSVAQPMDTVVSDIPTSLLTLDAQLAQTLALSSDRQQLVYAGTLTGQDGHELYLKNLKSGLVRQLTDFKLTKFHLSAQFVQHDQALLFISTDGEQYELNLLDLTAKQPSIQTLLRQSSMLSSLFVDQQRDIVLLRMSTTRYDGAIYRFDLSSKQLKPLTFPTDATTYDREPRLSPNGELLAFTRNNVNVASQLMIQRLSGGDVVQQILLPEGRILDIQWRNDQQILCLYLNKLIQVDLVSGVITPLNTAEDNVYFQQLVPWSHTEFIVVNDLIPKPQFYIWQDGVNRPLLNLPADAYLVRQSTVANTYYVVKKSGSGSRISVYDTQSAEEQQLLQLKEPVQDMQLSADGRYLHLQLETRLALYDIETKKFSYLTSSQQVVVLGEFSHDNQSLIFADKFSGEWRLMRYNLASGQQDVWQHGFIQARRLQTGYLLENPEGQFTAVESSDPLNQQLFAQKNDPLMRYSVAYPFLYKIEYREARFHLVRFNMETGFAETLLPYQVGHFALAGNGEQVITMNSYGKTKLMSIRLKD